MWQLANGGAASLNFVTSVNLSPSGDPISPTYSFSFNVSEIGQQSNSGDTFWMLGTYIRNDGYRSDEAVLGNLSGVQGWNPFTVTDYKEYTFLLSGYCDFNASGFGVTAVGEGLVEW